MAMPPVAYSAVPANPLSGGLYDAANLIDVGDARHIAGIVLEPVNEGVAGVWDYAGEDNPEKVGERGEWPIFGATTVWAADKVHTVGASEQGAKERAEHLLRLREPVKVEEFLASQLATVDAREAASIEEQLSIIEETLGVRGYPGVVHASRAMLPYLVKYIVRQGQALFTPGGHRWAFGGGYHELGADLVGTGSVTVVRSPVVSVSATDYRLNYFDHVAERVFAVAWEGEAVRVTRQS